MRTAGKAAGLVALACAIVMGCSGGNVKPYPLRGKVAVTDGDVDQLTGSHVEFKHETDELLRPTGKIAAGGGFAAQTLHSGKIVPGAPEGKYKARIVLADEGDSGVPKRKGNPVHKRFLDFETSGLSYTVPTGEITVSVSRK